VVAERSTTLKIVAANEEAVLDAIGF